MDKREQKDLAFYLDALKSDECLCERPKKPGLSVCGRCFYKLPDDLKKGLYARIGRGYERNFDEAIKYLQENVWE